MGAGCPKAEAVAAGWPKAEVAAEAEGGPNAETGVDVDPKALVGAAAFPNGEEAGIVDP